MEKSDLVLDIAGDVVDGDKKQISVFLLMILGTIISEIIKWFFRNYTDKRQAAKELLDYCNNMGPLRRFRWAMKVRGELRKHPNAGISGDKLAGSMATRFKDLTIDDIIALAEKDS